VNLHLHRNHLDAYQIDARPVDRYGPHGERVLDEVIVESIHPNGHGSVHLTPDQALVLLSRLTQLDAEFLHGTPQADLILTETRSGSEENLAWPVIRANATGPVELEEVIVAGGDRRARVHLSPEQVRDLERRLVSLALIYLHENYWGGEDARAQ
jgi:hypothetical protein